MNGEFAMPRFYYQCSLLTVQADLLHGCRFLLVVFLVRRCKVAMACNMLRATGLGVSQ